MLGAAADEANVSKKASEFPSHLLKYRSAQPSHAGRYIANCTQPLFPSRFCMQSGTGLRGGCKGFMLPLYAVFLAGEKTDYSCNLMYDAWLTAGHLLMYLACRNCADCRWITYVSVPPFRA